MQKNNLTDYFTKPFPTLDYHSDYILREQKVSDADNFLAYYNDQAVSQYILAEIPTTLAEAETEINFCRSLFYNKTGLYWSLALKSSDKMIGAIGYYIKSQHQAEICFDLHKNYWNQGIMSAALIPAIEFGRDTMKLTRISAITLETNIASSRLLCNRGFHHQETLHQHRYFKGQFYNVEKYILNFC